MDFGLALQEIIPHLDEFNFLAGTEGKVYFVNDDFVVKKYLVGKGMDYFNEFCREIKGFADAGLSVPKIYSWSEVPLSGQERNLYILEERVRGSLIFESDMANIYSRCHGFCDRAVFEASLKNSKLNPELFSMIVREYLKAYILTNETLANLPDEEIARFVMSEFKMGIDSVYSAADVQSANIMFDGTKLTHIDNAFLGFKKDEEIEEESIKSMIMRDMVTIFYDNATSVGRQVKKCVSGADAVSVLKAENKDACFEAMRKFVRLAKQTVGAQPLEGFDKYVFEQVSGEIVGKKRAKEILEEMQK